MPRLKRFSLLVVCLLWAAVAGAQYYGWRGEPVSVKWRRIETPVVKLIYPADFEENARRVLWYLDTIRPTIDFGFRHGTMRTPVLLHNRNMIGNGMVMWAPRRIDLLAAPGSSYSEPWLKQLAIHEYRHNVQYNNLRRGLNRILGWFLGEQIYFLGVGQFSIFILEGDATMAETEMSAFGRGLQPSFTMHYRAMAGREPNDLEVGSRKYANDYWFCGSFRDFVPDHYHLGYQVVRRSYDRFDKFIWDDIARYVSRNPQFLIPMTFGLKRDYKLTLSSLFRSTFADLNAYWRSLPEVSDSSVRIPTPETSYTTYRWPLWLDEETLVAFKSDFDRPNRIVRVDIATGEETLLAYTGSVSSRPELSEGILWWTEYRSSTFWDAKVDSRLVSFDIATGKKQTHGDSRQIFYPTPAEAGRLAYVAYDYTGRFSIVDGDRRLDFPLGIEISGLAWDDITRGLYFIGLDDGGMFLGEVVDYDSAGGCKSPQFRGLRAGQCTFVYTAAASDGVVQGDAATRAATEVATEATLGAAVEFGYRRLTPSRHITISDLRAASGRLYFGSIVSGKDEAHAYDLAAGTEYRLSESAYGSFQPYPAPVQTPLDNSSETPAGAVAETEIPAVAGAVKIALTTYDRHGYHLALQNTATATEQPQRTLPVDLVNPPWRRWNLPKMDSLVYPEPASEAASNHSLREYKSKKYRRLANLFRPHSWLPIDFYPPAAIQESDLTMHFGATVISQNLLSDAVSWLSYGWSAGRRSMLRGGFSYSGLGPVFDVDFTWGGARQTLYTLIPADLNIGLKSYLSSTVRVSLPTTLGSGYWYGSLTPSAEYFYTNGLMFKINPDKTGGILTRGVERLSFALNYSGQARMAPKEFLPRWGFGARVGYVMNPANSDFRSIVSASMRGLLPGIVRPHSTSLKVAWQQSTGHAPYSFRMKELFPRGARYDFSPRRWASGSLDYQFPVWYPERGLPRRLYFKRIRLNLFADYARWQDFKGKWHPLHSYGGDIILDVSPLLMPASSGVTARITIAKPSDRRGLYVDFGLELPL